MSGNSRPAFPDNLLVRSSGVKQDSLTAWTACPLKIGTIGCPETSVWNYDSTLHKITEERRSHTSLHKSLLGTLLCGMDSYLQAGKFTYFNIIHYMHCDCD